MGKKGSYAELHEELIKKGYNWHSSKGKDKIYINKQGKKATIKFLKAGRKAQRTNIRISPNVTMTRRHATPDKYELITSRKRKRKSTKKKPWYDKVLEAKR